MDGAKLHADGGAAGGGTAEVGDGLPLVGLAFRFGLWHPERERHAEVVGERLCVRLV